jgi:TolB-like protein
LAKPAAELPAPPTGRPATPRRPALRRRGALWLLLATLVAIEAAYWLSRVPENGAGKAVSAPAPGGPLVVGVMDFEAHGPSPDTAWLSRRTRDSLNTILSRFGELRVYAKEKIDFMREKRGLREIEVAQELGITKMVSGTVSMVDDTVTLEVRVVDIPSGFLDASIPGERRKDELIDLQNDVAVELLRALQIPLDSERLKRTFAHRTNETSDRYDLLYDTLGGFAEEPAGEPAPAAPPSPPAVPPLSHLFAIASAHAAEGEPAAPDQESIRELLERYRTALEAESIADLAGLHVQMTDAQRQALGRYFQSADALRVRIFGIDVVVEGDEALATFTREDVFTDTRSGREVHLEVRVSSLLAREDGVWKIRGLKRPS